MKHTQGMSLEQRAEWIADGPQPPLDRSGARWRKIYGRALIALRETVDEERELSDNFDYNKEY